MYCLICFLNSNVYCGYLSMLLYRPALFFYWLRGILQYGYSLFDKSTDWAFGLLYIFAIRNNTAMNTPINTVLPSCPVFP